MAQHQWCICVKPIDRVVQSRESHAPLGALRRGQMRQENSRGATELRRDQLKAYVATPASNPPDPPGRLRRHSARRAANVKVERPERSVDERPLHSASSEHTAGAGRLILEPIPYHALHISPAPVNRYMRHALNYELLESRLSAQTTSHRRCCRSSRSHNALASPCDTVAGLYSIDGSRTRNGDTSFALTRLPSRDSSKRTPNDGNRPFIATRPVVAANWWTLVSVPTTLPGERCYEKPRTVGQGS